MDALTHFEAVWQRCALLSGLHAYLSNKVTAALQPDELLRAEWVARVSALDMYVHEVVAQGMVETFQGLRPESPAYSRFQISNEAMGRIRNAAAETEAIAAFDLYIRGHLSAITYQMPDDIAEGIRLCSTVELWNEIAIHLGATAATKADESKKLKLAHKAVIRRRNAIAHEGDLQQPPLREPRPIDQNQLIVVRNHIETIVRAIDAVVT